MRRLLKGLSYCVIVCLALPVFMAQPVAGETNPIVMNSYSGNVEVRYAGSNGGTIIFDIEMVLEATSATTIDKFTITTQSLTAQDVQFDGKSVPYQVEPYYIKFNPIQVTKGIHKLRGKYKAELVINQPSAAKLQLFANYTHMHCYQAWFPVIDDCAFAKTVNFDVEVTIPKNWYMIGGWVPAQYRTNPKSDGKYRLNKGYDNPYMCKLVAGDYNVYAGGNDKCKVWTYSLKISNSDAQYYANFGDGLIGYLTQTYGKCGDGGYILAGQTGRAGNGQWIDGGFVQDQTYFFRQYNTEDIATHDIAKSWVESVIKPVASEPDSIVLIDTLAQYLKTEYIEKKMSPSESRSVLKKLSDEFWNRHTTSDSTLTSQGCTNNQFIVRTKGCLVLRALRGYMGDDKFSKGFKDFIARFFKDSDKSAAKPSLSDFKTAMAEANGAPIDDFWNTYFESGSVPIPQIDVTRLLFNGKYIEKLKCKNLESTTFPVTLKALGVDGKSQQFTFVGDSQEFAFDGPIAGVVNLSQDSLIPKPGLIYNTLGTGTISSVLAWATPQIVCLDREMMDRAQKWADLAGSKIVDIPDDSLATPKILVGDGAIVKYASESIKTLPIKNDGKRLVWYTETVSGQFSTTWVIQDIENSMLPIIIDTGAGDLPKDLSWTGIFVQEDGPVTLGYRNQADGQMTPPRLKYMDAGWSERVQKVYDCRFDLSLTNAEGFRLAYNGFDPSTFKFGKIEKDIDKSAVSETIYVDLKGESIITLEKTDRFSMQVITEQLVYDGKSKDFDKPNNLTVPKTVAGDQALVKWDGQLKYMYRIDGKCLNVWESGSTLLLQGLGAGIHKLEIVFYSDGMLGSVQEFSIEAGSKPPKLELLTRTALCKGGKIIVKGTTDPGCTIDPPAKVNLDGTFELTVEVHGCPKTLKITATNKLGVTTSTTVPVVKYAKIEMKIGSKTAQDESGNAYSMPVPPQIIKGSTYVPVRFIGERLGAEVIWDSFTKQVTYSLDGTTVEIIIDKTEARVNGQIVKLSAPALIVGGSTLVPVRFVAEALGASINYNAQTKVIVVEYPK